MLIEQILRQGEEHHIQHQLDKALDCYDLGLTQELSQGVKAHVLYLLGSLYSEAGKNGIARTLLELAEKDFQGHEIYNNLGIVYKGINRYDLAEQAYAKSLQKDYSPLTLSNLSGLYINVARPEKAYDIASKAFAMKPMAQSGNHMALACLEMRRWEEGFTLYEHRRQLNEFSKRGYQCPYWDGKKVHKLIIAGEQGLGDEIMFMSCWPFVKDLADEIVIECAERLVPLFERSFGVKCYPNEKAVMEDHFSADAYVHMGSLPLITRIWERWDERTFPFLKIGEPYPITADGLNEQGFRLGHSWRGGTNKTHDVLRNFRLELWEPLAKLGGISLQYGPAAGMAEKLGLPHDEESIKDIDKLASMVKSCDAVVTVCNTSAHIAGSLDVPCYGLTPHKKAWRYATDTERMRWYRSVVLIQQAQDEPWESVVQRTIERLHADFPGIRGAEPAAPRNAA
jgi:tetratricopeptide (TPR) repeat protein